jgi:hypothetical protein
MATNASVIKTLTHAGVKVQTDSNNTGAFGYASVVGVGGEIIGALQGTGSAGAGLPRLKRPIRCTTGQKLFVFAQAIADAVQYGSLAVYYASVVKSNVFQGLAVDATDVSMTSVVGGSNLTLGEALAGRACGLLLQQHTQHLMVVADTGVADGVNAFFAEDSSNGQLKSMMYAGKGNPGRMILVQLVEDSFRS